VSGSVAPHCHVAQRKFGAGVAEHGDSLTIGLERCEPGDRVAFDRQFGRGLVRGGDEGDEILGQIEILDQGIAI
jgi:hypothetical protein